MGWDFTKGASKQDIVNDLIKPWSGVNDDMTPNGSAYVCIDHSLRGNTLWAVWERISNGKSSRQIDCYILQSDKDYGWGYKSMSEDSHPYYYDCPLSFLDMVPVVCEEWRSFVHNWHVNQKSKKNTRSTIGIGDTLTLVNCKIPQVRITRKSGVKLYGEFNGKEYRIPPRMIGEKVVSA